MSALSHEAFVSFNEAADNVLLMMGDLLGLDLQLLTCGPDRQSAAFGQDAGFPLVVNGAVYGIVCGASLAAVSPAQTAHLRTAARTLSTILEQHLHVQSLQLRAEGAERDARIDGMTGLYNRRGWDQFVAQEQARARRHGYGHSVVFMDIDGLKAVNDEYGHAAGDAQIVRAAQAIRGVVREHDVAARFGGDEFALLATEAGAGEVAPIVERLALAFRAAGVSVSVGYACADVADVAEATREADEAMYRRKAERAFA